MADVDAEAAAVLTAAWLDARLADCTAIMEMLVETAVEAALRVPICDAWSVAVEVTELIPAFIVARLVD